MTVKFARPKEEEAGEVEGPVSEVESGEQTSDAQSNAGRLIHSHDPEGRYNHSHPEGDRPHVGHTEDGSPIFELPEPKPEEDDGCPEDAHLHVRLNRRLGMNFMLLDIGSQIVTGKGPWSLFSHCPKCGKVVEDRGGRHFRCDGDACDARWDVPRDQVRAARKAALHSPEGEEFAMLTPGG